MLTASTLRGRARSARLGRLGLLSGALALVACAAAEPESPVDAATRRLERAVVRAADLVWTDGPLEARVRVSPAACECPPWEVELGGSWVRVELRPARAAEVGVAEALETLATEAGAGATMAIAPARESMTAATGWRYPIFEVSSCAPDTLPGEPSGAP
ncbi:MAG: hypothetical protein H6700_02345 [Myxococcales bacterium]|nr:hypothetical protein [Myxococcales bacterium]MCB9521584.1 hypothetical protein [Myxococcales bacterium]MCB9530580.1 hypothetical protein [Myxococcales bacterium]